MTNNVANLKNVIRFCELSVENESKAWTVIRLLTDEGFSYVEFKSERAGYNIYSSYSGTITVSNLGPRFEINFSDGTSKNIWII